ncbi:MAG: ATP-binding protein [Candidatus Nomurabacteria bacterium]|nr:ATP-binding protein [Candidatus Nomurabacteria bacterium]
MLIRRENYLKILRQLRDRNLIKVVSGARRVGKSTLLQLFREELLDGGVAENQIQFINFEDAKNADFTDWRTLHDQIESKLIDDQMNYIFLDEVQLVNGFERLVDSLFIKKNTDIYITGSNAFLLSSELATLLTGRYFTVHVLPLSFAEYTELFPETAKNELFGQYLNSSSLPEAAHLKADAPELVNKYLLDVYETILKKDIMVRHEIRDELNFQRVFRFILGSVGSFISARSITDNLNSVLRKGETTISHHTVDTYIQYMAETFLLYKADRYDIKGKSILKTQDKYYAVDLGLRSALVSGKVDADLGHKLENLVYLELKRRNIGDIWVGKHGGGEVDFVVQNPAGERFYYQVAWTAHDTATLEREITSLSKIRDNFPKFLLTTDPDNSTIDGIRKVNVVKWLMDQND